MIIELGCGSRKRNDAAIGVDLRPGACVDVVADAAEFLLSIPRGSVSRIESYHFIEHIDDLGKLLEASARALEPGGEFFSVAPHFSSPYYSSDPTHRTRIGLYTMSYFVDDAVLHRRVPRYSPVDGLRLETVRLRFKADRVFIGRNVVRRVLDPLFRTRWAMEFYEDTLCWLLPCYEIEFRLRRT